VDRIVIVGGGLAAFRAAEALREYGFAGSLVGIGAEPTGPYNRPPLSKGLLTGRTRSADLGFKASCDLGITWRRGDPAVGLDPRRQVVHLASGDPVAYDGLVIATGVAARQLPGMPPDARIHTLRTLEDCRAFDRALNRAHHVAIIGGGFIGGEVASSLRERGLRATIIDVAPTLLGHAVGPQVGDAVTQLHRRHGVGLRLGTTVRAIEPRPRHIAVHLGDNATVMADAILIAVGTLPCVDWLAGLGLDLSDGVLCGPTTHVVGVPNAVAAGDCARWPNLRFDATPRRVEHWINAVEQARHAAGALLEGPDHAQAFTPLPRFWSEQYGVKIQSIGMPRLGDDVEVVSGSVARRRFIVRYRAGERPVGYLALDDPAGLLAFGATLTQELARGAVIGAGTAEEATTIRRGL